MSCIHSKKRYISVMQSTFPYEVMYTSNRNAYARIDEKKKLIVFSIPKRLKGDRDFWEEFFPKAERLRKRHQSRQRIEKITEDRILLFGEEVSWEDFLGPRKKMPSSATLEKKLKEILHEYAQEWLDIFSQQLHASYRQLVIRKSTAKR